ncbi:hypothetical protein TNCV_3227341 [Trichonephila clavipes]|nr:hypothetical protein TNCV_3227341 [Trichonephila clavipes]
MGLKVERISFSLSLSITEFHKQVQRDGPTAATLVANTYAASIVEDRRPPSATKSLRESEEINYERSSVKTVRMIADELQINFEFMRQIITQNLGMRTTCCHLVPRNLTDDQKQARLEDSQDFDEKMDATQKGVVQIEHPPYSPDLNPLDFFLFSRHKSL